MKHNKKKRYYAFSCVATIAIVALLLSSGGMILRRTLLEGLAQYDDVSAIAIPMLLIQDASPLHEAQARAEWEASQHTTHEPPTSILIAEPTPVPTFTPTVTPTPAPTFTPEVTPTPAPTFTPEVTPTPTVTPTPAPIFTPAPELTPSVAPTPVSTYDAVVTEKPRVITENDLDHTLFIGDSKTDGLRMWGRLGNAQYFCGTNFSVYNVFNKRSSDLAFEDAKLEDVLASNSYDQIYIILGYNEAGYDYNNLMDQFRYVIARVREVQPSARIVLHAVMHASARVAKKYSYYAVKHLEKINDGLKAMASEGDNMYFIDCNGPFCDENGYLLKHVSNDGEHLTPKYTAQWAQEIMARAITEQASDVDPVLYP